MAGNDREKAGGCVKKRTNWNMLLCGLGIILGIVLAPVIIWWAYRGSGRIDTEISADAALSYCAEIISGVLFVMALTVWQNRREKELEEERRRLSISPIITIHLEHTPSRAVEITVENYGNGPAYSIYLSINDNKLKILDTLCVQKPEKVCIRDASDGWHIAETTSLLDDAIAIAKRTPVPQTKPDIAAFKNDDVDKNDTLVTEDDLNIFGGTAYSERFMQTIILYYENCDGEKIWQAFTHAGNGRYVAGERNYSEADQGKTSRTSGSSKSKTKKTKTRKSQMRDSNKQATAPPVVGKK